MSTHTRAVGSLTLVPSPLRSFLELSTLSSFAVAQPVLDVMGRSPEFFLFEGYGRFDIVLLAIGLIAIPPSALFGLELALGLVISRGLTHALFVGGLLALLSLQMIKQLTGVGGLFLVVVAVALGTVGLSVVRRRPLLAEWARYLSPAPIIFVLTFLLLSRVSPIVTSQGGAATAALGRIHAPVVMLVLDELPLMSLLTPAGEIDADLYPSFARLAQDSTWFRNTTTVSGETQHAVPALLTGKMPAGAVTPVPSELPKNLFSLLRKSHALKVFEATTALCPRSECDSVTPKEAGLGSLLRDSAEVFFAIASPHTSNGDITETLQEETLIEGGGATEERGRARSPQPSDFGGSFLRKKVEENQPARFNQFLHSIKASAQPALHFLHLLLPHVPHRYLPSGFLYRAALFGYSAETGRSEDPWPTRLSIQRHLLQLAYTDRLLGRLLDRLEQTGLYEQALIVLVADHGDGFVPGEFPRRRLTTGNTPQLAWVPFLLKEPRQDRGHITDSNVLTVDVVPTIADALGIPLPWSTDGSSALSDARRTKTKPWYDPEGAFHTVDAGRFSEVLKGFDIAHQGPGGPLRLYRFGPNAELVGTEVAHHARRPAQGITGQVDRADEYEQVNLSSGIVPAVVSGRIEGHDGEPPSSVVAVAVNGRIGGTSQLFSEDDVPHRFAAIILESLLRPESNHLELFFVVPRSHGIALQPIELRE